MYSKIMVPLDGSQLAECVLPHVEAVTIGCKIATVVFVAVLALIATGVHAQSLPKVSLQIDGSDQDDGGLSTTIQILLLLTILALAPSIVIMMTSFLRIIIVLSFMRQALGTNQMPPSQLLMGMALILTMFVMAPVISVSCAKGSVSKTRTPDDSERPL